MPAIMHKGISMYQGSETNVNPTHAEANAPILIWPSAPILNNPALNAIATDSPVSTSGVALNKTCPIPYEFPRVSVNISEYTVKRILTDGENENSSYDH